jgi:hypothetical protein
MSRKRSRGARRLRVACISAFAALGITAAMAAPASAQEDLSFEHAWLKIALDDFEIINAEHPTEPTPPVVLEGVEDGAYTVPVADITFPEFTGELFGFPLSVTVTPNADLAGNYNSATGAVTGNSSNWTATIDFNGDPCTITPIPLAFGTATNSVFEGNAFDTGTPMGKNGAISDDWSTLPLGTGAGCDLINAATQGPGGLWLSDGVAAPTYVQQPPTPPPSGGGSTPPPTTKKCKKGQKLKKGKCVKKKKKKKKK